MIDEHTVLSGLSAYRRSNPVLSRLDDRRAEEVRASMLRSLEHSKEHGIDQNHTEHSNFDKWDTGFNEAVKVTKLGLIEYLSNPIGYLVWRNGGWSFEETDGGQRGLTAFAVYADIGATFAPSPVSTKTRWWNRIFRRGTSTISLKDVNYKTCEEHWKTNG